MEKEFCSDPLTYQSIKETKSFGIINYELLHLAAKDLSPSAFRCYLALSELADKVGSARKQVLTPLEISPAWLARKLEIDRSTASRALNELREKAFIKVEVNSSPVCLLVGAPTGHLKYILENTPDRKRAKRSEQYRQKEHEHNPKVSDILSKYNNIVNRYIEQGLSKPKAHLRAGKQFSEDEKALIINSEKNLPKECESTSKVVQSCNTKTINIKNNKDVITGTANVDNFKDPGSCFKFKKISKEIISERVTKLIHRVGDSILDQVGTLNEVIDWVVHHVQHRNPDKTKSENHALNAALSMLERGMFTKPKSLCRKHYIESVELEKRAKAEKEQEWEDMKNSYLNKFISDVVTC